VQIYNHVPYARISFYLFTIIFHLFLLIRSVGNSKYFLALILLIPVTAVSFGLWKFTRKAVVRATLTSSGLEIKTLFENVKVGVEGIKLKGKHLETADGRIFLLSPARGQELIKKLNK